MRIKITKTLVESTKPTTETQLFWDTHLKGFGLKVTPTGKKVFIYQARLSSLKNPKRLTIGEYADKIQHKQTCKSLTVNLAREIAEVFRGKMNSGIDPTVKVVTTPVKSPLISDVLDEFVNLHVENLKTRTQTVTKAYIENDIKPYFKGKRVDEVKKKQVSTLHARERNTPCRANHIFAILSKFFNWCEDHEYRQDGTNPCRHVKKYKIPSRERYLTNEENECLSRILEDELSSGRENIFVISAIQLLRLTGARRNEILSIKWDWLDLQNRVINLPDSKTGRKQIILSETAVDVILGIPRLPNNGHLIVGKKAGAHLVNLQKPWARIRKKAGLDDVRIHDLRHSFASAAVTNGLSLHVVGGLLGHKQASTTYKYAHLAPSALLAAANKVAEKIN